MAMFRGRASRGLAAWVCWLGAPAAADLDVEQLHVTIASANAVVVSWASPNNTQANLAIEELDPQGSPITSTGRTISPTTETYQYKRMMGWGNKSSPTTEYTSPLLLHAEVAVHPMTSYRYKIDDGTDATPWRVFKSPPAPGDARLRLAIVGDIGQTNDSRRTCSGIAAAHAVNPFDAGVLLGDLAYSEGLPERWDTFGRMFDESGCSDLPWLMIPGNHELEPDDLSGEPFLPYRRRWKTPEVAPEEVANDFAFNNFTLYDFRVRYDFGGSFYSVQLGPAHIVALNPYTQSASGSAQHLWLKQDLESISRNVTPFVVALTHAPWQHSSAQHLVSKELATKNLQTMAEPLLNKARADLLFAGHVHAYERTVPISGMQHFMVGNGGNYKGLYDNWLNSSISAFRRGNHFGWGTLELSRDACSWLMHQSEDGGIIDSVVFAAQRPPPVVVKEMQLVAALASSDGSSKNVVIVAIVVSVVTFCVISLALIWVCSRRGHKKEASCDRGLQDYSVDPSVVGSTHGYSNGSHL